MKDLPDLALLATTRSFEAARLRTAIAQTFWFRNTHAVPTSLPAPPVTWTNPYAAMARGDRLPWSTLGEVTTTVQAFLDPMLAEAIDAEWQPDRWSWPRR